MINVELRRVAPGDLANAANAFPGSVLVCRFDSPLTPLGLGEYVAQMSSSRIDPDAVDIRTIRYEGSVMDSTALSLASLAPHTDGSFLATPPPRFVLSCIVRDSESAGASTLIPIEFITDSAPSWVLDALLKADYQFLRTYDGDLTDSFVGPVLSRREDGTLHIRWRADHLYRPKVVDAHGTRAADAAEWLHVLLDTCDPFTYVIETGELLVIPNDRVVHGRQALSTDSRRTLLRAWVY